MRNPESSYEVPAPQVSMKPPASKPLGKFVACSHHSPSPVWTWLVQFQGSESPGRYRLGVDVMVVETLWVWDWTLTSVKAELFPVACVSLWSEAFRGHSERG